MAAEASQARIRPAVGVKVRVGGPEWTDESATGGWRRRDVQTEERTGCARMSYGWVQENRGLDEYSDHGSVFWMNGDNLGTFGV
jgi:hypothetical protein